MPFDRIIRVNDDKKTPELTDQTPTEGHVLAIVSGVAEFAPSVSATDHGALTGLGDDDHTQYETTAEVAAQIATHTALAAAHHTATAQRRVVMRPGITSPPEPVSNPDGDGWVYMEIAP